ncbi:hypothetical protein BJY21_000853 [Kineosphaera limosa]|uniref:DUF4432 family protein n=1 Tax=Kineosphaera limosa TaxID=111564 RepID=UPI00030C8FAA|nr:DUF4432 family protein [Kineosphaera limosa]NYD99668.1 hypothetical protein [Kineosphaera limosa]
MTTSRWERITSRPDLLGSPAQLARLDHLEWTDGPERGARLLRLVTGGGLEVDLLPDRAFDVGRIVVGGIPLAWTSPTGFAAPGLAERDGFGWLRTFGGGLLATCGMDTFGDPSVGADGTRYPQHGRFGTQPGRLLRADIVATPEGDEIVVEAEIVQAAVHGDHLAVRRTIRAPVGSRELSLVDVVENRSDLPQPHMVLYHVNLGWPLLGPSARVESPDARVAAANAEARAAQEDWNALAEPSSTAGSLVYLHTLPDGAQVEVAAHNPDTEARLTLRFDTGELPWMHSWKVLRHRQYVLGIEPSNCPTMTGRADADALGTLPVLAPGERRRYALHFSMEA